MPRIPQPPPPAYYGSWSGNLTIMELEARQRDTSKLIPIMGESARLSDMGVNGAFKNQLMWFCGVKG